MTEYEAEQVAEVLCWVDGGCSSCVNSAVEGIQDRFPEFDWQTLVKAAKARTSYMPYSS